MVVSTYGRGGGALGAVGVIGPSRMDYKHIIPLVRSAGVMVSENFSSTGKVYGDNLHGDNVHGDKVHGETVPGEDVRVRDTQEETG